MALKIHNDPKLSGIAYLCTTQIRSMAVPRLLRRRGKRSVTCCRLVYMVHSTDRTTTIGRFYRCPTYVFNTHILSNPECWGWVWLILVLDFFRSSLRWMISNTFLADSSQTVALRETRLERGVRYLPYPWSMPCIRDPCPASETPIYSSLSIGRFSKGAVA